MPPLLIFGRRKLSTMVLVGAIVSWTAEVLARTGQRPAGRATVVCSLLLTVTIGCGGSARRPEVSLASIVDEFTAQMPREGEGGYVDPSASEALELAAAVLAARRGATTEAGRLAAKIGYEVRRIDDPADDDIMVFTEAPHADGSAARGWGLFAIRPDASPAVVVEVPHPVSDVATERLGLLAFEAGPADALLIAGAHRAATADANVANNPASAFEVAHRALLSEGATVVQFHGFNADSHPGRYGNVVVSDGLEEADAPSRSTAIVARELEDRFGLEVCLHHEEECARLAGTENLQGRSTRGLGGDFIHVELDRETRLRIGPDLAADIVEVLSRNP